MEPDRRRRFFRGSEFSRLLILAAIMVVGWVLVWQFAQARPQPPDPGPKVEARPEPVVPDKAAEFDSVTDRTPLSFRDNAAYAHLLDKARALSAPDLAGQARRDILLAHLWERPELYRGVPIHILGTARRVLRYEAKMSKTGWIYETWIVTQDERKVPYCCVSEEAPVGFPLGANVAETVVFNGFFLKIMKYEAADTLRGSPLLVGKIGWELAAAAAEGRAGPAGNAMSPRLYWTLVGLGAIFLLTLCRWICQLSHFFGGARRDPKTGAQAHPAQDIRPETLDAWVSAQARSPDGDWDDKPSGRS